MSIPSHTEIFRDIKDNYDPSLLGLARLYVETEEKIATYKQHLAFNLRTKRYGLTPRSLRVRPLVSTQEGRDIARRTSYRFLGARITQNVRKKRDLEHNSWFQRRQLAFHLDPEHLAKLDGFTELRKATTTERCKTRQKRKFDTLLFHSREEARAPRNDRWVVNLSS